MTIETIAGARAVVTGAASGIGRAIVEELLRQGASVYMADIHAQHLETATRELGGALGPGQRLYSGLTDVADPDSVAALASAARAALGDVDLLFANAGIASAYGGAPDETPLEDWHRQLNVNLFGVVHCLRAFLPAMRAKGRRSHIVITASSAGLLPTANRASYAASKHAVVGLGESLYLQLQGSAIGVSLLCPGVTNTPMLNPDLNRPDGKPGRPLNPALLAHAKPAAAVARMAVEAVVTGRFWILTHEDLKPAVLARAAAIAGGTPPPDSYH